MSERIDVLGIMRRDRGEADAYRLVHLCVSVDEQMAAWSASNAAFVAVRELIESANSYVAVVACGRKGLPKRMTEGRLRALQAAVARIGEQP